MAAQHPPLRVGQQRTRVVVEQAARLHVGARRRVVVAELDLVGYRLLEQAEQPARRHLLLRGGALLVGGVVRRAQLEAAHAAVLLCQLLARLVRLRVKGQGQG